MPYTDTTGLEAMEERRTLIKLSDDWNRGQVDTTITAEAIASADGIINSRVTVPATVPQVIRWISGAIAVADLWERRGKAPFHIDARRARALAMLEQLRKGDLVASGVEPIAPSLFGAIAESTQESVIGEFTITTYDSTGTEVNDAERYDDSAGSMDTW